jgi:hypothetical protein
MSDFYELIDQLQYAFTAQTWDDCATGVAVGIRDYVFGTSTGGSESSGVSVSINAGVTVVISSLDVSVTHFCEWLITGTIDTRKNMQKFIAMENNGIVSGSSYAYVGDTINYDITASVEYIYNDETHVLEKTLLKLSVTNNEAATLLIRFRRFLV